MGKRPAPPRGGVSRFLAPENRPSDPEPNPLDKLGDPTDDLEQDSRDELDAVAAGFRDRMKREGDRFRRATDSEHWFAVCFVDRAAKEAFLRQLGGPDLGDKYVDGHELAKRLGYTL